MVDTRNKRASAIGMAFAALSILPAPDAAVSQADRQQVAYCYAGISAGQLIVYQFVTFEDATLTVPLSFESASLESPLVFSGESLEPV